MIINTLCIFGTRPEAIKMAPVIKALEATPSICNKICITSQHKHMLDSVLNLFQIKPDFDLQVMTANQRLADLSAAILLKLEKVLQQSKPHLVIVQGDTTSSLASALAAFYHKIPIAHIEAGLRTGNIQSPWPEEMNRKLTDNLSSIHFAPTQLARNNLLREGVSADSIFVTGNTVIDALLEVSHKIDSDSVLRLTLQKQLPFWDNGRKIILVTGHRRESFGKGFENICTAIAKIAVLFPEVDIVYPVHPNPNVQHIVNERLNGFNNIFLIPPLEYDVFVYLMKLSYFILTDSGGIQEEAPYLHKPVLVMRELTERGEALDGGIVELVGTHVDTIVEKSSQLLTDAAYYSRICFAKNPFGDGKASTRIAEIIAKLDIHKSNGAISD